LVLFDEIAVGDATFKKFEIGGKPCIKDNEGVNVFPEANNVFECAEAVAGAGNYSAIYTFQHVLTLRDEHAFQTPVSF